MTLITDMGLPDEVVEKAMRVGCTPDDTNQACSFPSCGCKKVSIVFKDAIRAALQAMVDGGMAYEHVDGANAPILCIKIRRAAIRALATPGEGN